MSGLFDVSGKTALVTGGSRGIGLMIARGLLGAGAKVIVSSRKEADVKAAAAELSSIGECVAIPADVSTPKGAGDFEVRGRVAELGVWTIGAADAPADPPRERSDGAPEAPPAGRDGAGIG